MLIGFLGAPSPLTYWTLEVLKAIAQVSRGVCGIVYGSQLADLQTQWNALDAPLRECVILFSEIPDTDLTASLLSEGVPIIVAADDPSDTAAYLSVSRQLDCQSAIRLTSQCFSTISETRGENVLLLGSDHYDSTVRAFVEKLLTYLAFPLDDGKIQQIVAGVTENAGGSVGAALLRKIPHAALPGTYEIKDPGNRILMERMLKTYGAFLENKSQGPIVWPREIFLESDRQGKYLSGIVSLFGMARCVIYGPYLYLPRGAWTARVEIEVDGNYSGNRLRSDVLLNFAKILTGIAAPLPQRGVFQYAMNFEHPDPNLPLEIRLLIERSGIEGRLLLRVVELTRTGDVVSDNAASTAAPFALREMLEAGKSRHNAI